MTEDTGHDDLRLTTRDLRRAFPAAEADNDPRFYEALVRAMAAEAYEPVRANLLAQRSLLRVLSSAALNAPGRAPDAGAVDDAWRDYQRSLNDALVALRDLLAALPPSP